MKLLIAIYVMLGSVLAFAEPDELMEQVSGKGNAFSYIMGAIILYYLYEKFKEGKFKEKLEKALDNIKDKLD